MTITAAIAAKGQRVTAGAGPKWTGVLVRLTTIGRMWYAVVWCDDGEERFFRPRGIRLAHM